jgi:hypothetical protein
MKTQFVRRWFWRLVIIAGLVMLAGVTLVWGFAEEHLYFRDPHTGETGSQWEEISTIHDDLTYAMALAAGFDITDSITLQIWNQLVDSEQLGPGSAVSYTNCSGGAFYPTPSPGCINPLNCSRAIWPQWSQMAISTTCITSRYGPYSPFFHFPHLTGTLGTRDIGALHDWAWGLTQTLVAYDTYAWGRFSDLTVMQAQYRYTRTAVITTGMEAGSLEAFGTYLHSLADAYSHRDCIAAMDALGMPWATHTITASPFNDPSVPACDYNPFNYSATDVHGREFYTYTESYSHTDAAVLAVYTELVSRSVQMEGRYPPLNLDTPMLAITGTPTLSEALHVFVHNWDYDQPASRRAYADLIARSALMERHRIYLPLVVRS